jgi:hypothetical protein
MVSFFKALTPSLVGGIVIGILSGIPLLNIIFPLFLIGGYLAVSLYKAFNEEEEITEKDCIYIGFWSGFFGSFFGGLILLIVAGFFCESFFYFSRFIFGEYGNFLMLLSGFDIEVNLITLRNRFIFNLVACIVFGIVGGYLYSKRKRS